MQFRSSTADGILGHRGAEVVLGLGIVLLTVLGALVATSGSVDPSHYSDGALIPSARVAAATPTFPVSGVVENSLGAAIPNASVIGLQPFFGPAVTNATGQFTTVLPQGSYAFFVEALGSPIVRQSDRLSGPIEGLVYVLTPVFTYPLSGNVVYSWSGNGIGQSVIQVNEISSLFSYTATAVSQADGAFQIPVPNGTLQISVSPPPGHGALSTSILVAGAPLRGIRFPLSPIGVGQSDLDPYSVVLVSIPIVLGVLAAARFLEARQRRAAQGLPSGVFSPFTRRIAMRAALIPFQLAAILTILYIFGYFLVEVGLGVTPCQFPGVTCTSAACSWASVSCTVQAFWYGSSQFLVNIFTLNWGTANYGAFSAPATQFLMWWAPNSLELAIFALGIAFLLAYPLGLLSGWKAGTRI